MPYIDEKILKAQIKNREFSPVYVLFGTEPYMILKYRDAIINSAVTTMQDMNIITFDGRKVNLEDVIEACNQLPAFNDYRCVILNDFFPPKDFDISPILDYLSDPVESTVLMFVYSAEHPAKKGSFKSILDKADALEFLRMDENSLVRYIAEYVSKRKCRIQAAAARYLIMNCGTDMLNLNNELEKLCAYRPSLEITEDDIDRLCPKTLETNAFNITKEISAGNPGNALKKLSELLIQKQDATQILGAISYSYISMYRCYAAYVSGIGLYDFAEKLAIKNPSAFTRYQSQAKKLGSKNIIRCLKALYECDRLIKRNPANDKIILEQAIVTLCAISGTK